mgnify:CR=1 FL=1
MTRKIKKLGCFSIGMLISIFLANGDAIKNTQKIKNSLPPEDDYISQLFSNAKACLSKKLEKELNDKPFLKISCSNINNLFDKTLKFAEKLYPGMSSLLSISLTSFLGGTQYPGEEGTSPIHMVLFFHKCDISPILFLKLSEESPLFKALSRLKTETIDYVNLSPKENKKAIWWMFGEKTLLNLLQDTNTNKDTNINEKFPFLNETNTIENLLQIDLDFSIINEFSADLPFIGKQFWDTLIKPEIKQIRLGLDYIDNNIITNCEIEYFPNSSSATLFKGIHDKSKQIHCLDLTSHECIQNFVFQDFSGMLTWLNTIHEKLNDVEKNITEHKKQNKNCDKYVEIAEEILKWWNALYPLFTEILNFCNDNLTGNFQSYANIKQPIKYHYETMGFGLFEGKAITNEILVNALKNFITISLPKQLKQITEQKLFGSEVIKSLSCVFNKNFQTHEGCPIQNIYWMINKDTSNKKVPLYFSVCKNHLLYADNIDSIKRLIERINSVKTFTYVARPECFEKTQIRLSDFIEIPVKMPVFLNYTYSAKVNPERLILTSHLPLWFNFETLKNFSNQLLPSQQKSEEIKKDSVDNVGKPITLKAKER